MYFYQKMRDLREDHDLKQKVIADFLGTSQTQYSRWERGEREIPLHLMIELADFYGVTMDYICDRKHSAGAHGDKVRNQMYRK